MVVLRVAIVMRDLVFWARLRTNEGDRDESMYEHSFADAPAIERNRKVAASVD